MNDAARLIAGAACCGGVAILAVAVWGMAWIAQYTDDALQAHDRLLSEPPIPPETPEDDPPRPRADQTTG